MALDTIKGTALLIKVGNGASPEVFEHPCLINTTRGIQFQSNSNKIITPDCDNPDDPAWTEVVKDGLSATISGAGTLDATAVPEYDAWFQSPAPKNVQVWVGTRGHWQAGFQLTGWSVNGNRNDKAQVSITLESDGNLGAYVPVP